MSQNFNAEEDFGLRKEALKIRCPNCKGRGKLINTKRLSISTSPKKLRNLMHNADSCPRCKGTGKLDWIEMATGKKEDPDMYRWSVTDDPGPR